MIGILGEVGVKSFGLKSSGGRRWFWDESGGGEGGAEMDMTDRMGDAESANKLYVGMLIMLIFSEALALYGLIVALILSQHNYHCA